MKKNNYELVKQLNLEELGSGVDLMSKKKKMKEKEILRLIGIRDKARKQGRYQ